jgi:hypothetical protein
MFILGWCSEAKDEQKRLGQCGERVRQVLAVAWAEDDEVSKHARISHMEPRHGRLEERQNDLNLEARTEPFPGSRGLFDMAHGVHGVNESASLCRSRQGRLVPSRM